MTFSLNDQKKAAARAAVSVVKTGMVIGLGTGSTVAYFLDALGEAVGDGLAIRGVATSRATEAHATSLGIPIVSLDEVETLDLTVDGADEIDPQLSLIKGGGGALLREKIVAYASRELFIIADQGKYVPHLGRFALPVEIVPFAAKTTVRHLAQLGQTLGLSGEVTVRMTPGSADAPFVTDNHNYIADCGWGNIPDPKALSAALGQIPGVVEHGLFLKMTTRVFLGEATGSVRVLEITA